MKERNDVHAVQTVASTKEVFTLQGTHAYIAPEMDYDPTRSEKTDAFAAGVVLLQILTGLPAFDQDAIPPKLWARRLRNPNLGPADDWVTFSDHQTASLHKAVDMLIVL